MSYKNYKGKMFYQSRIPTKIHELLIKLFDELTSELVVKKDKYFKNIDEFTKYQFKLMVMFCNIKCSSYVYDDWVFARFQLCNWLIKHKDIKKLDLVNIYKQTDKLVLLIDNKYIPIKIFTENFHKMPTNMLLNTILMDINLINNYLKKLNNQ